VPFVTKDISSPVFTSKQSGLGCTGCQFESISISRPPIESSMINVNRLYDESSIELVSAIEQKHYKKGYTQVPGEVHW